MIDGTTVDDAEDLGLTDYYETTRSLWFYSKDETTNFDVDVANNDNFKPFKYKAKLLEITVADKANGILSNAKIPQPLKYVTNI